jgi:hypothetical protein
MCAALAKHILLQITNFLFISEVEAMLMPAFTIRKGTCCRMISNKKVTFNKNHMDAGFEMSRCYPTTYKYT